MRAVGACSTGEASNPVPSTITLVPFAGEPKYKLNNNDGITINDGCSCVNTLSC